MYHSPAWTSISMLMKRSSPVDVSSDIGQQNKMDKGDRCDSSEDPKQWDDLKRARNRINSQRTRERERAQVDTLEADKTRLWLSNDALKYQNQHLRDAVEKIRDAVDASTPSISSRGGQNAAAASSVDQQPRTSPQTQQMALSTLMGNPAPGQPSLFDSSTSGAASSGNTIPQVSGVSPQMHLPQNLTGLMVRNEASNSGTGIGHHAGLLGLQGNAAAMHRLGAGMLPSMTNRGGGVSSYFLNQAGGAGGQGLFPHGGSGDMSYNMLSAPPSDGDILSLLPGLDLRQTSLLQQQQGAEQQHQQLLGRRSNTTTNNSNANNLPPGGGGKDYNVGERPSDELDRLRKGIKRSRKF